METLIERRKTTKQNELDELARNLKLVFPKDSLFYWINAAKEIFELSEAQAGYLVYGTGLVDNRRR